MTIQEKFAKLGIDNAPGQETLQKSQALELRCGKLEGAPVDFSHGDVDAHIPTPGSFEVFAAGVEEGGAQAYTPYRGRKEIRDAIMAKLEGVPGVSARPTEGGSYLFVTIPELDVSLHQFIRILRQLAGVTVTPGTEFGPQYLHQFRINFSQDKEKAVAAMERLLAILELYRKH